MEYCNGGELEKALDRYIKKTGKPFPQEFILKIKDILRLF